MSTPRVLRIAAIPADGVGREVVAAGREVLDTLGVGSAGAFDPAARLHARGRSLTASSAVRYALEEAGSRRPGKTCRALLAGATIRL